MKTSVAHHSPTYVIRPRRGWFELHLWEIWQYRDLITMFVKRDFVAVYKQTVLGPLWYLISPLTSSLVFTVVFGQIARIPTGDVPPFLFYYSGLTCWSYLSNCVGGTSSSFVNNASLFGKVYFPRLISPLSMILSNLTTFLIQFTALILMIVGFYFAGARVEPNWTLIVLPFIVMLIGLLGLSVGLIVSAATVKYRDISYLIGFGMQLWMYGSPVIYPSSQVPERYRFLYHLNPMAPLIETFRHSILGTGLPELKYLAYSASVTLLGLLVGIVFFNRAEKNFMDVV